MKIRGKIESRCCVYVYFFFHSHKFSRQMSNPEPTFHITASPPSPLSHDSLKRISVAQFGRVICREINIQNIPVDGKLAIVFHTHKKNSQFRILSGSDQSHLEFCTVYSYWLFDCDVTVLLTVHLCSPLNHPSITPAHF